MKQASRWTVFAAAALSALILGFSPPPAAAQSGGMKMGQPAKPKAGMGAMAAPAGAPTVPAVAGYSEGRRILFIHTETSDPKIAKLLTDMMGGSPVLLVPALAKVSRALHAHVYVFANGLQPAGPRGPLGFQPDVFPDPPGSAGYFPLRSIVLVKWKNPAAARLLKTAAGVEAAIRRGEATREEPGIIVNMPFLTWPGGKR